MSLSPVSRSQSPAATATTSRARRGASRAGWAAGVRVQRRVRLRIDVRLFGLSPGSYGAKAAREQDFGKTARIGVTNVGRCLVVARRCVNYELEGGAMSTTHEDP